MPESRDVTTWLRYASEDLTLARSLAASDSAGAYRQSCFFAQQAAEKAIKAALIHLKGESPRWHDLESLRALLPRKWRLRSESWQLEELSDFSVAARYPGQMDEPSQDEANVMVKLAGEVLDIAEADLRAHGWRP